MPRNGSDVDPKNINWNLNRTLKVRQITSDLLEREAAFPVLLMGSQVPLTCGDCGDCCGFFGSGGKVAFPRLLKVVSISFASIGILHARERVEWCGRAH